tara:strand:- start:2560 stop:2982 length:423 start_codon:yes stop_codon:yes gene_type:complete
MTDLDKFIEERLNQPFVWGENDCITFCMDAIKVCTRIDHLKLENVRTWNTPQSAKKTLLKMKIPTMFDLFDKRFKRITNKHKLRDGDIGIAPVGAIDNFSKDTALVFYKDIFLAPGLHGIERIKIDIVEHFFDIRNIRMK